MSYPWSFLNFWKSGEWQVVQERLDDLTKQGKSFNPKRKDLFKALSLTPYEKVRVCILGQDPYPGAKYASGLAFSIPANENPFPPTLKTIFREYQDDLHYPEPTTGDLTPWCTQGALLWNVWPSCETGKSMSHHWTEWTWLTKEIIESLNKRGILFVALGREAQDFGRKYVDLTAADYWEVSHPSPLAKNAKLPFLGSRIFTTINSKLCDQGLEAIDWRLE